jgi:hypothetical protein
MTGAIAMGTSKITGLGNPTSAQDAATKTYVDTADALKLNLTGGTMSGAIAMGTNKITGVGNPTLAQDAATKDYVDDILGSATSAATSAAAAALHQPLTQPHQLQMQLLRLQPLLTLLPQQQQATMPLMTAT